MKSFHGGFPFRAQTVYHKIQIMSNKYRIFPNGIKRIGSRKTHFFIEILLYKTGSS